MMRGLKHTAFSLLCGLALAEPAAWALMRLSRNSSMPAKGFDITVYSISAVVLLVISLSAMYLPAFRQTRVDPMHFATNSIRSQLKTLL
jgi:ABC-type antimicrobial peptide transport system permease subunit